VRSELCRWIRAPLGLTFRFISPFDRKLETAANETVSVEGYWIGFELDASVGFQPQT